MGSGHALAQITPASFAPALFCSQPHCLPPGEAAKARGLEGGTGWLPHPQLHPTLSLAGADNTTAHEGSGAPDKNGMGKVARPSLGLRSQLENLGVRKKSGPFPASP